MGVFLGFPLQATQSWIKKSWIHSSTYENGVYLPDLFKWDGLDGYIGAITLTAIIAFIIITIAKKVNKKDPKTIIAEEDIEIKKEKIQVL